MDISNQMLDAVANVKKSASTAESEFDRRNREIQKKANESINLFGGEAPNQVVELVSDSRLACDELYATYQSLIPMLDRLCRPMLEQSPSADAVNAVQKMIKWLNDESEIKNNYTASLNSQDLGGIVSAKYIPTIENKMIQKFWEQVFETMPESKKILEKEKKELQKKEKAEYEARKYLAELKRCSQNVTTLSEETHATPDNTISKHQEQLESIISNIQGHIYSLRTTNQTEESELSKLHLELDDQIEKLRQDRKSAGLFALKQKKELGNKIADLIAEKSAVYESFLKRKIELEAECLAWEEQLQKTFELRRLISPQVGDVLQFGTDPISKNKSSISWIVIQVSYSRVALISRDILGYGIFKSDFSYTKKENYVDWLKTFEKKAFSVKEKKALLKSPINYYGCPQYVFVYTNMDAKKHLQKFLSAKPTQELLDIIQSSTDIQDYDRKSYTNTVSSSYWLHSRDEWNEDTVNRVKRDENGNWKIGTLSRVTNDEFMAGIRPAILVDRAFLTEGILLQPNDPSEEQINYHREQLKKKYVAK